MIQSTEIPANATLGSALTERSPRGSHHRLFVLVVALQFGTIGSFGLDLLGLHLAYVGPLVGFLYLTVVPGSLLLVISRSHLVGVLERAVCAVGLSVAFVMLFGLLINFLLPTFGLRRPISASILVPAFAIAVLTLLTVAYTRTTKTVSRESSSSRFSVRLAPIPIMYLTLILLLAPLGAYTENRYENATLLYLMILLIAVLPLMVLLDRYMPKGFHGVAIGTAALALLWHHTLITDYISGWDINIEFYFAKLVQQQGLWNPSTSGTVNSMLSITIMAPEYSEILNVDLVWVFKLVYPVIFALVPVALYLAYRRLFAGKVGFFGTFLFVGTLVYYVEMPGVLRQDVAELFFALSILVLAQWQPGKSSERPLMLIFGVSLALSHYGLSYIYLFELVVVFPGLLLLRSLSRGRQTVPVLGKGVGSSRPSERGSSVNPRQHPYSPQPLTTGFVTLLGVFALSWYVYTSFAAPLVSIVNVGSRVYEGLSDLLDPGARGSTALLGIGLASTTIHSIQRQVFQLLQLLVEGLIGIGLLEIIARRRLATPHWYMMMSLASTFLLVFSIALPFFAQSFNATRIYHVALFFLAPAFFIGGTRLWSLISRPKDDVERASAERVGTLVIAGLLVTYFLFSTGVVFSATGDVPISTSLDSHLDYPRFNTRELSAAAWLEAHSDRRHSLYADPFGGLLLDGYFYGNVQTFWGSTAEIPEGSYIYLRCVNVDPGLVMRSPGDLSQYVDLRNSYFGSRVLTEKSLVYDDSCSAIYV